MLDNMAVGYTLEEIPNDLTGTTPASFEPTLDYVVVKVPRFAFEKFPGADTTLGTQMKSVGEAMGIGRTFTEALAKALRSRELDGGAVTPWPSLDSLPEGVHPWFRAELERYAASLQILAARTCSPRMPGVASTLCPGVWAKHERPQSLRRRRAVRLGFLVQLAVLDEGTQHDQQQRGTDEAHDRRN